MGRDRSGPGRGYSLTPDESAGCSVTAGSGCPKALWSAQSLAEAELLPGCSELLNWCIRFEGPNVRAAWLHARSDSPGL